MGKPINAITDQSCLPPHFCKYPSAAGVKGYILPASLRNNPSCPPFFSLSLRRYQRFSDQLTGTLIGSHSFGVLANQMGIRAAAYFTEDVDVARREALAFDQHPGKSFLDMLRDSGINFVEVPELDLKKPASSFKQLGTSRFHVDLLVPSDDDEIRVVAVPELKAHATALPYLAYLLGQTQIATLISREGCCPVRIPVAERFAVHKLLVSQLRTHRDAKSEKDIFQAAVILAALGEKFPGAIEIAVLDTPRSARRHLANTREPVVTLMHEHPRAAEEFEHAVTLGLHEERR